MSKVAIIHHTLTDLGGAERVFAFLVHALNRLGIVPDVYSSDPVEPSEVSRIFGVDVSYNVKRVCAPHLKMFGLYRRALISYLTPKLDHYDVVYNTTGVLIPILVPESRYVLYVYNPTFNRDGDFIEQTVGVEKYRRGLWSLYINPFRWFIRKGIRGLARPNVTICAVSNFTRDKVRRYWGLNAVTVYPPVDTEKFSSVWDNVKREGVILIGRYTPEKRHHELVEVAKKMRDVTFRLVGTANTPHYRQYLDFVRSLVERYDLKNVEIHVNVPFKKLVELLGESKILVHALRYEDFGLTPAEGVCGGVVPLVHDSGGLREVVPFPEWRFSDTEEMALMINALSKVPYQEVRPRVERLRKYVVHSFSAEKFMDSMLRVGGFEP